MQHTIDKSGESRRLLVRLGVDERPPRVPSTGEGKTMAAGVMSLNTMSMEKNMITIGGIEDNGLKGMIAIVVIKHYVKRII